MTIRRLSVCVATLLTAALLGGCMNNTPAPYEGEHRPTSRSESDEIQEQTAAAWEELKKLERMTTVEPRYDTMQSDIMAAIAALVPGLEWTTTRSRGESPCREPYSNTPGLEVTLLPWSSDTPIPAKTWPAVADAVNAIATANGFDGVDPIRVDGNLRQLGLNSPDGGSILLGSGGRTALLISTGCFLRN